MFQEGIVIPPSRVLRDGVWNEELIRTFARNTRYERPKGRLAYLDTSGDLVVAGSTYAGGNEPDWLFINKYDPQGTSLLSFVSHLSQAEGKISDEDWQMLEVTDDPERVVELMRARYGRDRR